jgi:hypothetical protein
MGCVGNAKARLIYPRERDLVPIIQEAGWGPRPLWVGADLASPPGFDLRTIYPVASRYVDYAFPAQLKKK